MPNVIPHPTSSLAPMYNPAQLSLVRRTFAKDCNDDEFNIFIQYCKALRLDPLRKQVYAFVFSKDDAEKRRLSVVVSIEGLRAIAERTGNYMPDDQPPVFETDAAAMNPLTNPLGLVSCTARVRKFSHGAWHTIAATAYWDEFAPFKTEGADGFEWVDTGEVWPDTGRPKKKKRPLGEVVRKLDTSGKWGEMPRHMLAKVAEAQALRKAWPDDFANVYGDEEVAQVAAAEAEVLLPSEAAEQGAVAERREKVGLKGQTIMLDLLENATAPLQPIPVGQFYDRCDEFIKKHRREPSQIVLFRERNVFGLREFYTHDPKACNAIKRLMDDALANPPPDDETTDEATEADAGDAQE